MNNAHRFSRYDFEPTSFVDILRWRALHHPNKQAFKFLTDGEFAESTITYEELDCKARAIGALLQGFVSPGECVLLLYPPGLEYIAGFFGCLYAGVIAVPAYPPDPLRLDRTLPRLLAILNDIQSAVVLTTSPILSLAEFLFDKAPDLGALQWMATDNVASGLEYGWNEPKLRPDNLAFLQYTSGSTRTPKGVMVSQGNLLHNSALISQGFGLTSDDVGVIWLPPYHDMGLIGGILQPVVRGMTCVLLSPLDFLQKPIRWLQAISRYRGSVSGGPNFSYDLCIRKVAPEQRDTLDLSNWSVAFSGAEPVRAETLDRFAAYFEPCGFRREAFYPCYGLAEGTLIVSGGEKYASPVTISVRAEGIERDEIIPVFPGMEGARTLVGCGKNLGGQKIVIVDTETMTQSPPDRVGEIWVSGPSVARGYWNLMEESKKTFQAYLRDTGEGPFLRTGDLGFIKNGELFICGRLKDLIIVDGLNHYPQDIEQTMEECHPAIRAGCSAAFSIAINSQEQVVAVAEVALKKNDGKQSEDGNPHVQINTPSEPQAIITEIRKAVSKKHDLRLYDVVLLKPRSIPKTSSGKIQRHECRAGYLSGKLEIIN
jgi:acyl-CoA synthetase (AMP-forming)/AMP-acid ligase II